MIDINKLFSENYGKIYQCVFRIIGNRDDSEDITQDVFINIFNNINLYNSSRPFLNWAKKIAYNAAIDFKRKEIRVNRFMEAYRQDKATAYCSEYSSEKYNSLTGKYRLVYELKMISKVPVKEISIITGIPIGSVTYILTKIKNSTSFGTE